MTPEPTLTVAEHLPPMATAPMPERPPALADPDTEIIRLALERGVAAEQLDKIIGLQERLARNRAEAAFNVAMNDAQAQMPAVVKDAENKFTQSRYARLEAVIKECKPVYTAAGFSVSFGEGKSEKPEHIRVVAHVHHRAGLTKEYFADFPADASGMKGEKNKSGVQAVGSTFSYGRRYLTLLIFNIAIADEDTDGNAAGDTLNAAQVAEVNGLIEEVKQLGKPFDFKRFMEWCGAERLDLLPQRELGRVTYELKRRIREAAKNTSKKEG